MPVKNEKICSVDGCERVHYALGYCNGHWQRDRKGKSLTPIRVRHGDTCHFPGCGRQRWARQWCQAHYNQNKRGEELRPIRVVRGQGGKCLIPDCDNDRFSKGCCSFHHHVTRYNLTDDQIVKLYTDPRCSICGAEDNGTRNFHVDHDHSCCDGHKSCGKCVRGLLCRSCNQGIGFLKDDISVLRSAISYLSSADRI